MSSPDPTRQPPTPGRPVDPSTLSGTPASVPSTHPDNRPHPPGSASADPPPDLPSVPGYVILDPEPVGEGAMGTVYRARQAGVNRVVALKVVRGGRVEPRELARFRAEAAIRDRNPISGNRLINGGGKSWRI